MDIFKKWIDLGVKAVIAVSAMYLIMVLFFKADLRRTDILVTKLNDQVTKLEKQTQFLTAITMNNNPDTIYHMALESEARGDMQGTVRQLSMAIQLSEYNAQQYKLKLAQLAGK